MYIGPAVSDVIEASEIDARVEEHLDLVDQVAGSVARNLAGHIDRDELCGYGREGLFDAARRFEADRGVPFPAYATFRIRGAMLDGVRRLAAQPRRVAERLRALEAANRLSEGAAEDVFAGRPEGESAATAEAALSTHLAGMASAMALGLIASPDGVDSTDAAESPEEATIQRELVTMLHEAIQSLPEVERALVERHYFGGERFDHVASSLGLSKSWASRLHARAVKRLSQRLSLRAGPSPSGVAKPREGP
jgi:RNA polymerase sigma factor FliA